MVAWASRQCRASKKAWLVDRSRSAGPLSRRSHLDGPAPQQLRVEVVRCNDFVALLLLSLRGDQEFAEPRPAKLMP